MQFSPFLVKDMRVSHVFSCLFRQMYIRQCKFHIISSSHSTCTAWTTMYYRFFNVWNKLLKCTYVHLSLFHSNVSNIQHSVRTFLAKHPQRFSLLCSGNIDSNLLRSPEGKLKRVWTACSWDFYGYITGNSWNIAGMTQFYFEISS